ncbi:DUF2490 domain-containing protein [Draconibacterium sp. IB214405]|nr:DUF2490 domain-containing protein [Draconibacterium sp. IB214405]
MFRYSIIKILRTFSLFLLIWFSSWIDISAQNYHYEFWPEADIWYKITPGFRVSSIAAITKYLESNTRDLNVMLQADQSFGKAKRFFFTRLVDQNQPEVLKSWLVRGGYGAGWSLYDKYESYSEDMIFTELHRRIVLKHLILFSQRIRFDNRWLGQDHEYSYRFRFRAMFEREIKLEKTSIVPYISIEPFYDSRFKSFNRVRSTGGATISLNHRFDLEGTIVHQYDSNASSPNVLAFNAILHIYFETPKVRKSEGE